MESGGVRVFASPTAFIEGFDMATESELAKEYARIIRVVISEQLQLGQSLASPVSKQKIVAVLNDVNAAVNKAATEPVLKKRILALTARELDLEKPDTFPDLIIGSFNQQQTRDSGRLSEFIKNMKRTLNRAVSPPPG
jgi:hypothetical protein